jgi:enterochelin esterase-like enzyme
VSANANASSGPLAGRSKAPSILGVTVLVAAFVVFGLLGVFHYLRGYWLYRGFPPPHDPGFVTAVGRSEKIFVQSPAIGGRRQEVDVYLPSGYDNSPQRRYPVFYLLHGFPGRPAGAFLLTTRLGVVDDILVAKHRAQPVILVMPFGSTGTFTDKEWANGVRRGEGWETFVARDVVRAIDARYRTVPTGAGRALGGLSEGGYGALNIGLHHPGEFHVLESWSGYVRADNLKSVFGGRRRLLRENSPLFTLPRVAGPLRAAGTFIWFYSGTDDPLRKQNAAFAGELARYAVAHRYLELQGGHNWALWRGYATAAFLVASRHLAHG